MLANITSESSHCFQKGNRNSGCRLCITVCPSFWEDYYMLIYTHCWELMNSVGSHGSLSLPFVMKVMICHFVSDSHEVMTALIVVLPLIVVVEISLQLHRSSFVQGFQHSISHLAILTGHHLVGGKVLTRTYLYGLTCLALFVDMPGMLFRYAMIDTWFSASELGVICRGSWKLILPV